MKSIAELRAIANRKNKKSVNEAIPQIESIIEKAAENGHYAVVLQLHDYGPIIFSPDFLNYFSGRGFAVHRTDTMVGIKW